MLLPQDHAQDGAGVDVVALEDLGRLSDVLRVPHDDPHAPRPGPVGHLHPVLNDVPGNCASRSEKGVKKLKGSKVKRSKNTIMTHGEKKMHTTKLVSILFVGYFCVSET